jgi:hypothetical protein
MPKTGRKKHRTKAYYISVDTDGNRFFYRLTNTGRMFEDEPCSVEPIPKPEPDAVRSSFSWEDEDGFSGLAVEKFGGAFDDGYL